MDRKTIDWTSPREWPLPVKLAAGAAAVVGFGVAFKYMIKRADESPIQMEDVEFEGKSPGEKAQALKTQGNSLFQSRNYSKATELFSTAIELMKSTPDSDEKNTNLAILYNNLSACFEFQNDLNGALEYTTRAISLNPDYIKPYVRRSRIYKIKKDSKSAIKDLAKIFTVHANTKDSEKYMGEMIELSTDILRNNVEKNYIARSNREQFLPISQANLMEWMNQTVTHDPILKLLPGIDDRHYRNEEEVGSLGLALYHLKRHEYERIISPAFNSLVDESVSIRDRFIACLLLIRIYQFAGLTDQAKFVFEKLNKIWKDSSEAFKANNTDLIVSLLSIKSHLDSPETVEIELKQNLDICQGNADPFVVLFMAYYNASNTEKAEEMLKLARKVEPNRPHLEFYEISLWYLNLSHSKDLLGLHNLTAELDRRFSGDVSGMPEFAILNAVKIFHTVQNTQLGLEIMTKYMEKKKDHSILLTYLYVVLKHEMDPDRQNATTNLVNELELLLLLDPYNFEINRLLFRCYLAKDHEKAAEAAERQWLNTRSKEEFASAYHDLIVGYALAGLDIPTDDWFPEYVGPEYIHANSPENSLKIAISSTDSQ